MGKDEKQMFADLSGKRALITGSSRGIGSAIAAALAEAGADIVLHCSRDGERVRAMEQRIRALGRECTVCPADLSTVHGADGLIARAGHIDILVLNASMQFRNAWQNITPDEFDQQVNCNWRASLNLIQQAVPTMKAQKWGRIVVIGSVQEAKPHPDMLVYSASKAAQTAMIRSLALQLAADGITLNDVAPGVIYTDRNTEALSDPAYAKKVTDSIPMGYYGEKEDCAGIVRLLCADEARYITGQQIYVDGGKSL